VRNLFGLLCVCALGLVPLVGCGTEALCEGVECEDDGNECTDEVCDPATGECQHITVEDDTACDFGGSPGLCQAGVCVDAVLCEGVECEDDGNDCTVNECDPATGSCVLTTAEDGTGCSDGICQEGVCRPACIENVCHCSEAGIRAAIELGGSQAYTFDCSGPTTVTTDDEIGIDNDVILDGEGNLTVDGNEAHRVFSIASRVAAELRGITITRGATNGDGGGIHNDGTLVLTHAKVSANSAASDGGGIWNQGTLTLTDSAVTDNTAANSGGGIENISGSTELTRCTVSGNTALAGGGGAIESGPAALLLTNTTVSGNFPTPGRGAIESDGDAMVIFSTLQQLPAGGDGYLWGGGGWVVFFNTILNGECTGWLPVESFGSIESPGDTCGLWYEDRVNVSEEELNLGPLQDNGGPTLTQLPGPGSVAIDAIEPEMCLDSEWNRLDTDQRGVGRPQGPLCDVGSVEGPSLCGGVDCDDRNECTDDRCDPTDGDCTNEPVPDYWYCDFSGAGGSGGSGGTGGYVPGLCRGGVCTEDLCAGNPCDDGNQCTFDECDRDTGECTNEPVPDEWYWCDFSGAGGTGGAGGSGGSGGTGGYAPGICYQGECIENLCWDNPCDDGNECTWDDCSIPDGSCSYTNVPDGNWCMNGTGECVGGACELYPSCGAERTIPPSATTDTKLLYCEGPGFPIGIEVTMAVTPSTAVEEGPIEFETQFEFALTPETVDWLLDLVDAFAIESLGASIDATMGDSSPTPVWVYESPVPCVAILEPEAPYGVVTPITNATWTLDVGSVLELTAQQFEEIIEGMIFTTEEPISNCAWETTAPSVSFTAAP
jgi:hypothetical protein